MPVPPNISKRRRLSRHSRIGVLNTEKGVATHQVAAVEHIIVRQALVACDRYAAQCQRIAQRRHARRLLCNQAESRLPQHQVVGNH